MNTFLEKVTRSPNAASRIAAASLINESRSRQSRRSISGNMAVNSVRGVIRSEIGEVGRRVDVARQAGAAHDHRLDAGGARLFGVAAGARLAAGEGEIEHGRRAEQQGVGAALPGPRGGHVAPARG